jgi:hypothetical protein
MRKHVFSASSAIAVAVLLGVAFAGLPVSTTIQSDTTTIREFEGQTFEITTVDVEVDVTFLEVNASSVEGQVTKLAGQSGSVTIRWIEGSVATTVHVTPSDPEQLFGLEGGDGDKRHGPGRLK